jgi:ribosomal-protein-alanine N-acetyltransferase
MTVSLRTVSRADLEALARLHAQCFAEDAWDAPALASILAMKGAEARLAEAAEGPLGLLFAVILAGEAEILTIGVAPRAQRRGIGRLLLEDLFARARALGAHSVMLEVAADNSAAIALYEALGFRTAGLRHGYYQRERGPAIDAWLLRATLD